MGNSNGGEMTGIRWASYGVLVGAFCLVACSGAPTGVNSQTETRPPNPQLDALFSRLEPPRLQGVQPPRLVLRDGPSVPDGDTAPLTIAIARDVDVPVAGSAPPLKVLGFGPTGDDALTGAIRVTFDQPMVPVAQLRELNPVGPAIEITPPVEGKVRWLGTTTWALEPKAGRLALATDYTVKVPAGTRSALGGTLEKAHEFRIRTPEPSLVEHTPYEGETGVSRQPWIVLRFNQRVDPAVAARHVRVEGVGNVRWRLVSESELAAKASEHPQLGEMSDRTVVLMPEAALPAGQDFRVTLPAGFIGAEGPKPSTRAETFTFRTIDPLSVTGLTCGWGQCVPGAPVWIETNNPIATTHEEVAALLRVQPTPADFEPRIEGNQILLNGTFAPRTTVRVQLNAGLRDIHGQVLDKAYKGSVTVGDVPPQLSFGVQSISTLERAAPRELGVDSLNVKQIKTRVAKVERADLMRALFAMQNYQPWDRTGHDPFTSAGLTPIRRTIESRAPRNTPSTLRVPIGEVVPSGAAGYVLVEVESAQQDVQARWLSLVQVTDLNALVLADADGALVRVLSLASAQPVAGAKVELLPRGNQEDAYSNTVRPAQVSATAQTDAVGMARLAVPGEGQWMVRVSHGDDQAVLETWIGARPVEWVGTVFTDRDPYRPGDTVHLKLIARTRGTSAVATTQLPPPGTPVSCALRDAHYQQRETFDGVLNAYGTFAHDVTIEPGAALGHWHLNCDLGHEGGQLAGTFQVQEYRAPEIEVSVRAPEGTFFRDDRASFVVDSSYLFGAPAADLPVQYTVAATPEAYAPPGHPDYHFGDEPGFPMPWLRRGGDVSPAVGLSRAKMRGPSRPLPVEASGSLVSGTGVLSADGTLAIPVALQSAEFIEGPIRVQLEAAVTDLSRQQVANRASVIAHPAAVYVGVRNEQSFVADTSPIVASLLTTDVAGVVVAGRPLAARLLREVGAPTWHPFRGLSYDVEEKEVARCDATSALEPKRCTFPAQPSGRYSLEVTTKDERERVAKTRTSLWVYGTGIRPWFSETPSIEISADKETYAVGDVAKLLVRAPIASGRGLLTLERRGIVESRAIELNGSIQQIEVPITDAHVPNLTVRLSLARGRLSDADVATLLRGLGGEARRAAADDIGRPLHVTGSVELQVNRDSRRLNVTVTPDRDTAQPGEELVVSVDVKTPDAKAADAEVTLMVVDEAVLSLLGFETPDPLPALLPPAYPMTSLEAIANALIRRVAAESASPQAAPAASKRASAGMAMESDGMLSASVAESSGRGGNQEAPSAARTLFATTAHYVASARTDGGKVRVKFKLPDNLTRFRLMALAVSRTDLAGSGEGAVTVRKPLLLRPALPRVATFGDHFEASVIVHNETGAERDIIVGIRAAGLSVEGAPIRRERFAVGEAREVSFPVLVDEATGAARVQFAAMTEGQSDAVELDLPLIAPATSEAFATYGSLTEDAVRYPLLVPEDAIGRFGGLELSLSSTALTDLSDGADYLVDYPYECAEQISGRLIAAANLSVALVGRDDERAAALRQVAEAAVAKLKVLRRHDGSFGMWPGDSRDSTLRMSTTAWVGFALHEAQLAQVPAPQEMTQGVVAFLDQRLQYAGQGEAWNLWDRALAAYALAQLGATPPSSALEGLWQKRQTLPMFAQAWLASTLRRSHPARSQELLRVIRNAAVETAAGAHFAEHESEGQRFLWHSDHRTDAIVLHALLELSPNDPLVEKTVRGLMAARRNGRWRTTQENAWALSALTRYFRAAEAETPDMTARAWLGSVMLAETPLRGRSSSTQAAMLPMSALQELGSGDLTLGREGDGRLYYRVGLRYAPSTLLHDPEEQGFAVTRVFESVGEEGDVRRDAEGQWHIKAGANVRVRLTVVVPDTRYDVALDDPIAAGLEPVNMAFATTASQALGEATREDNGWSPMWGWGCWMRWAFDHRELRDDRVTAFSDAVSAGVYELVYLARATTPGRFIAAPTKIEEMYAPETFARSGSDVVIVER